MPICQTTAIFTQVCGLLPPPPLPSALHFIGIHTVQIGQHSDGEYKTGKYVCWINYLKRNSICDDG